MAKRDGIPGGLGLEVLKALWDLGPSRVRAVRERLEETGHRLAYNTVQTLLNRLVGKGRVQRKKEGNAFVYRAAVRRDQAYGSRIRSFVGELFDGSSLPLISHLLREGKLSDDEVDELRSLIDERSKRKRG